MEIKPGMFVSAGQSAEWVEDPEVPGSSMHELVHDGPIWAGMTRIEDAPEPMAWTPDQREVSSTTGPTSAWVSATLPRSRPACTRRGT